MNSEILSAVFLAVVWATFSCGIVRFVRRVPYDFLGVFWVMTVFAFSLLNLFLLTKLPVPHGVMASGLAFFGPVIASYGYRGYMGNSVDSGWPKRTCGAFLVIVASMFAIWSRETSEGLVRALNDSMLAVFPFAFVVLELLISAVGILLLMQKRTG